jgi:hypothetical protein
MRKLLIALCACAALIPAVTAPAFAGNTLSASYSQIESEIGCTSKATDAKKEVIFNQKYRGRSVEWTGIVHDVKGSNKLWLNDPGSHSLGSDFDVEMVPGTDLLQFDKGQRVTVRFQIRSYMGCILPLRGDDGTIVSGNNN